MQTRWKWLCWVIGHKWQRFGFPSKDDDIRKSDSQLMLCRRCHWMPIIKHNGDLPRFREAAKETN